jgi:hypothetical protein
MPEELKATLTYNGESVDMSNLPAAEKLVGKMVTNIIKEGERTMGEGLAIRMDNVAIDKEAIKDKEGILVTVITIEAITPPENLSRILNLQRQRVPLYCIIGSDQALFDLKIEQVNIKTGEIKPPESAKVG